MNESNYFKKRCATYRSISFSILNFRIFYDIFCISKGMHELNWNDTGKIAIILIWSNDYPMF